MNKTILTTLVALSLHLGGCIEADEAGYSTSELVAAGDYEDIYYHHCIGYDGNDDKPSPNPSACTADSQCSNHADCPTGKTCSCDVACGCCVVEDWEEPKADETYTRYMWTSCPANGAACQATITKGNETKFFSQLEGLTSTDDLIDKLCMMHVVADDGCIYTTTAAGSACSLASDDPNAGKYECGNKVCADNEIVLCTGAFTYTLVTDNCSGTEMPEPTTAEVDPVAHTEDAYCIVNLEGEQECSPI